MHYYNLFKVTKAILRYLAAVTITRGRAAYI
jgi:hypothetical protein